MFSPALVLTALISITAPADEVEQSKQRELEKAFEARMTNVTLTGTFTNAKKMDQTPKPESYEIESVKKLSDDGNLWVFMTRIKYGKLDTKLPVTVPVVWADGLPMVSLKNATLPGLGNAFSARVIFDGDRYAGTWQHGEVGGHMFGMISKPQSAKTSAE